MNRVRPQKVTVWNNGLHRTRCELTLVSNKDNLFAEPATALLGVNVPMAVNPVIRCEGVTKSFGPACVVRDVSLALEPGEILALVGPSGSGKTTLLRLLAGFEEPDSGSVFLEDKQVAGPGTRVPPEERHLGMVFQDYALFPHMTVQQNVAFGLKGLQRHSRERRAWEILEMVRLQHLDKRYPHQLSGGEQQRIALARSLAPRPVALLLDEPFSNLDPQLRLDLRGEVKDILRYRGVTTVYVTHDQEEALFMGDRVAVINAGRLEQVGSPEEIFHNPSTRFVAQFLGIADFVPATATEGQLVTEIGSLVPPAGLPPGTSVEVMVRPDDVYIHPSASGSSRVVDRVFRGMHYLYSLALPSGTVLRSLQHHTALYQHGQAVDVLLAPNQPLTCFMNSSSAPHLEDGSAFTALTIEQRREDH